MSTTSAIGIKTDDGTVRAVGCHWDGYPEGVGRVLTEFYGDRAKVGELLALGQLSELAEKTAPEPGTPHSWQEPRPGVTVAYHRDRGDPLIPAEVFGSPGAYAAEAGERLGAVCIYLGEVRDGRCVWRIWRNRGWRDVRSVIGRRRRR